MSSTVVRFGNQWFNSRLWWDDYLVIVPFLFDIVYVIMMWLKLQNNGKWFWPSYFSTQGPNLFATAFSWSTPVMNKFMYSAWFSAFLNFGVLWYAKPLQITNFAHDRRTDTIAS